MNRFQIVSIAVLSLALSACQTAVKNTPATPISFAKPERWQTANGLKVTLVSDSTLPMVDLQLTFKAGSAQDYDQPGLASLTNEVLFYGAKDLSEEKLNQQLDQLGAELDGSSHRDMGILQMRCLSDQIFNQCQRLLQQLLKTPDFGEDKLQRSQQARLTALEEARNRPEVLSERLFWQNLYLNHPYGTAPQGTIQSISSITADDLKQFYRSHYTPDNAHLVLVGDLSLDQARQAATEISQNLPPSQPLKPLPSPLKAPGKLIEYATDSQQNHIKIGQLGIQRDDPQYVAFYLANQAMGGSALTSILGDQIREQRGWAYSIWSSNSAMLASGTFIATMQTQNDNAQQAISVLSQVLANGDDYLSDEIIDRTRQFLLGNFPLQLDNNRKMLGFMSVLSFYDLEPDYLTQFYQKLSQVSNQEVRQAWRDTIKAEDFIIVNVGKID